MNFEYFYSLIILGLSGFIALAIGIRKESKKIIALFTFIILIISFILVVFKSSGYSIYFLDFTDFNTYWALIFIVSSMVIILPSMHDIQNKHDVFYALILFMTLSMVIAAYTFNLIVLFVSFEGVSVITYILAAYNRTKRNLEGSLKYFVISTIGTAFTILGISYFYFATRTFNLLAVSKLYSNVALLLALVFIIIGFGFEIAIFPMHQWAIDTYDGSPNSISSFLSTGSKLVAYMVLLKILYLGFIPDYNYIFYFFAVLSILTMTYGNISALSQNNIKRTLAYSSVAQAGNLILVFAIIGYSYYNAALVSRTTLLRFGIAIAMFYSLAYIFMKAGPFIAMSLVKKDKIMIDDFIGLARKSKVTAFSLAILLLALAGIPVTGGFLAKYFLFFTLIIGGLWWLAVISILNSVISVFYYFRIILYSFWKPGDNDFDMSPEIKYSVIIMALITIALGFAFTLYTYLIGIAII